jgi:hypothetical protein
LKVTIDSSEPLADALRVIGALYDVTLVVAPTRQSPGIAESGPAAARAPRAGREQRRRPADKEPTARATKPRGGRARTSAAPVDTAGLRSWARDNGYTVSDRGRVAASIAKAYEAAHRG